MKWSENDELFFRELRVGHEWQRLPAVFFALHNFSIEMPALSIRESIDQASTWKDQVDLVVEGHPIEIKSRNESFTSPESFPYETIIVDTVSGYDAKLVKPLAYIMISRPTGAMLTLRATTPKGWSKAYRFDHVRRIHDEFYLCDRDKIQTLDCLVKFLRG